MNKWNNRFHNDTYYRKAPEAPIKKTVGTFDKTLAANLIEILKETKPEGICNDTHVGCASISCCDCPFDSRENMDKAIAALEAR